VGCLGPIEKLLGEWLLDQVAVEWLARMPLLAQSLSGCLKPLFLEYESKFESYQTMRNTAFRSKIKTLMTE